jgi:membrane protein YdbS with pleckstrin-like domain
MDVDEHLLPTERRVIRVRNHWAIMAKDIVLTGLFLLLMVIAQTYLGPGKVIDNLTFYLALAAVIKFTVHAYEWWNERIVITDKRVMLDQGIITTRVGMMPLGKVTDLTFERTATGRMLGYGTIIVESAGQIQALNRIEYVPNPQEVYEALSELIFGEKGRTAARSSSSGRGGGLGLSRSGLLPRPRFRG